MYEQAFTKCSSARADPERNRYAGLGFVTAARAGGSGSIGSSCPPRPSTPHNARNVSNIECTQRVSAMDLLRGRGGR